MGSARLYSALNTKISKISSELLSDEDFKKLLEADTNKDQYDYLLKLGKIEGEYANEGVSQSREDKLTAINGRADTKTVSETKTGR